MNSEFKVVRCSNNAHIPTRCSSLAAGYDLYSAVECTIPVGGRVLVSTGLKMCLPEGCYARVAPRSGLALKFGLDVGAGVIDADYRGIVSVLLFNFGEKDFLVKPGERIAQLILEQIFTPTVVECEDLDATLRGAAGFGSTGI